MGFSGWLTLLYSKVWSYGSDCSVSVYYLFSSLLFCICVLCTLNVGLLHLPFCPMFCFVVVMSGLLLSQACHYVWVVIKPVVLLCLGCYLARLVIMSWLLCQDCY